MSQVERAIDYVKQRGYARTLDLAKLLCMIPGDVDLLLEKSRNDGMLLVCDVQIGDTRTKEYRCTASKAVPNSFRAGAVLPPTPIQPAAPQASTATAMSSTVALARAAATEEPFMSEKRPASGRILEALKAHGPCNLDELATHTRLPRQRLLQMMGMMKRRHGLVSPKRGVYELPGAHIIREVSAELARRKAKGSPYAALIADLEGRRDAKLAEISKIEDAIEAVKGLA